MLKKTNDEPAFPCKGSKALPPGSHTFDEIRAAQDTQFMGLSKRELIAAIQLPASFDRSWTMDERIDAAFEDADALLARAVAEGTDNE